MSTFVNPGEMIGVDNYYSANLATQTAGLGYVSISASNQNHHTLTKIVPSTSSNIAVNLRDDGKSETGTVPEDPTSGLFPSNNRWWTD